MRNAGQGLVFATSALACAAIPQAGKAQAVIETQSSGERSEFIETFTYGEGTTLYAAETLGEVNGEITYIGVPTLEQFGGAFTPEQVAANVNPPPYVHNVGGVEVTVTAWSDPTLNDSYLEVSDSFIYDSFSFSVLSETSVQTTSGDGPDAFVPTGFRGFCSTDGTSGSTNYGAFDGSFASCEYETELIAVAPGTIVRNTHSTTIYREQVDHFESYDYLALDSYLVRPRASQSWSAGDMAETVEIAQTLRRDTYATTLTGMLGETAIFEETLAGQMGSAPVRERLAALSAPTAHALAGAPVVLSWSAPERTGASEALLASATSSETTTAISTLVTVTTTYGTGSGETVAIGERGSCTSAGVSGTVNGPAPTGAVAACEGGIGYLLAVGETNTNTHTTVLTTATILTTTTEDWLNAESFVLQATATAVGQVHAAVWDPLLEGGRSFAALQGAMLRQREGLGFGLWLTGMTGSATRDPADDLPGWRHDGDGLAGGLSFALSGIASLGLSASHRSGDLALAGVAGGGSAKIDHTQIALGAQFSPGIWQVQAGAGLGWADIDTTRGAAALGGVSTASYSARTQFAWLRARPEFDLGPIALRPYVGGDWNRVRSDGFVESAGIPLFAPAQALTRTEVRFGTEFEAEVSLPMTGWGLRVEVDLAGGTSLGDNARERVVAFAGTPASLLTASAAAAPGGFGEGRAGVALTTPFGATIHLGATGRLAKGEESWQADAGLSFAF